ncbi:MAG: DUF1080 domain-containing protein [Planctomycetota bacterium]|nr:DUF1080 domain-containing protein [Planctomycetota bacterium]
MPRITCGLAILGLVLSLLAASVAARPAPPVKPQPTRPKPGQVPPVVPPVPPATPPASAPPAAPTRPEPLEEGYTRLFNGKDFLGWDADPEYWSVKDRAIRGEVTTAKMPRESTACVLQLNRLRNVILRFKFRVTDGVCGVVYRCRDAGNRRVSGYTAEMSGVPGSVGLLMHEGRGALADVGEFVIIDSDGKRQVLGAVADKAALAQANYYKGKGADEAPVWNDYTIIARGNHLVHLINGYQTVELIDNDTTNRDLEGGLAFQIRPGLPATVEIKDIRARRLKADFGDAARLFTGKDLSGWTPSSDPLKNTFGAKDGVLTVSGAPSGYLRTTQDYASYVLSLQVRHVRPGGGGVLLRLIGPDKVWPRAIECQMQPGTMGNVASLGEFPMTIAPPRTADPQASKPQAGQRVSGGYTVTVGPPQTTTAPQASKPQGGERAPGEWNRVEIMLDGGNLEVAVNGIIRGAATGCQDTPGRVGLASKGGAVEYRNIVLIPILREGAAPAATGGR